MLIKLTVIKMKCNESGPVALCALPARFKGAYLLVAVT